MKQTIFNERFKGLALDPRLRWLNAPPEWGVKSRGLTVRPAAKTDFWQRTHYGFRADNGHFLYTGIKGDFELTTAVSFRPAHQYDQAGLMVRVGASCWIKTAVEYEAKGPSRLGAVVTNFGHSDWSMQDFPRNRKSVLLRICRQNQDFVVQWAEDSRELWRLLRMAHLHETGGREVQCGVYACSPKGSGFRAEFEFLQLVTPPGAAKE